MPAQPAVVRLHDLHPTPDDIAGDVRAGLALRPKRLPSKYFYDARGSQLFEAICAQPEYYLTRTELAILRTHGADIAAAIGPEALLVEYGSGAGTKTRLLLEQLRDPVGYLPIEIAREALMASVDTLAAAFPRLQMLPVCADFTRPVTLPRPTRTPRRTAVFFPGSTLGNFEWTAAIGLLKQMRGMIGAHGCALVGIDLKKDPALIEAAYNDAAGVTAAFTLNLLTRLNREIGTNFDVARFRHHAGYNPLAGRIETHIVSRVAQDVSVLGERVHFGRDEGMLVEYSCKYSPQDFARMAARAGLRASRSWTDPRQQFAVVLLERDG